MNWDNIQAMIASMIQESLAGFLAILLNSVLSCAWFTRKWRDCIDTVPRGGGGGGGCPKCCNDPAIGIMKNKDVCQVLWQQRNELEKIKKRLDVIEKDLKNTTDCES